MFGIFFSCLLHYAYGDCNEGVYLHTRRSGKLFNLNRLKAKISSSVLLDGEINSRIAKAMGTKARFKKTSLDEPATYTLH